MSASTLRRFLLPHTEQGEIDWNTLGNIVTGHLLAESLYVSHVDGKYGVLSDLETTSSAHIATEWRFDYEKNGITIFRKKKKDSNLTCFSGRGLVAAPYATVAEFLKNIDSTYVWDKFLVDARYLRRIDESPTHTDYLGYQMHSASHCFSTIQRDMLYFVRCKYIDGKYVQSAISVEDPDYPQQKTIPRCDVNLGSGFVVEPYRGSSTNSLVTYFGSIDVKGVPMFIMTQVLRRQPLAVHYIQRHFDPQSPQHSSSHTSSSPPPPPHSSPSPSPLTRSLLPYEDSVPLGHFTGKNPPKEGP